MTPLLYKYGTLCAYKLVQNYAVAITTFSQLMRIYVYHVRRSARPYSCHVRQFAQLYTRLLFMCIAQ